MTSCMSVFCDWTAALGWFLFVPDDVVACSGSEIGVVAEAYVGDAIDIVCYWIPADGAPDVGDTDMTASVVGASGD